jgi:hypothetical protein
MISWRNTSRSLTQKTSKETLEFDKLNDVIQEFKEPRHTYMYENAERGKFGSIINSTHDKHITMYADGLFQPYDMKKVATAMRDSELELILPKCTIVLSQLSEVQCPTLSMYHQLAICKITKKD